MDWHKVVAHLNNQAAYFDERAIESQLLHGMEGMMRLIAKADVAFVLATALEAGLVDSAKPNLDGTDKIMPVGN